MFRLTAALLALGWINAVHAQQYPDCLELINNYRPDTRVTSHLPLDLDIRDIDEEIDNGNWTGAIAIYSNGKNAPGRGGAGLRNLRSYSLNAGTNYAGMPVFEVFRAYWDSATYADDFIMAAAQGTGDFAGANDYVRAESMVKGIQYQAVWAHVIRELEQAVDDCEETSNANITSYEGVHSLDEAWAIYSGSLEKTNGTGGGYMLWAGAQKRCAQFGTCGSDRKAIVNKEILGYLAQAQALIRQGRCASAAVAIKKIIQLMVVPLIQGTLRYVHRGSTNAGWSGTTTNFQKERGEGWAFTAAILPLVHNCSAAVALRLKNNMFFKASPFMNDGAETVVRELQSVYPCLGISCKDVGTMKEGSNVIYEACTDPVNIVGGSQGSSAMTSALGSFIAIFATIAVWMVAL